jgi:hypothetical protein
MDGDTFNPIQWWVKKLDDLPTVAQYALDLLCCPVMSAECERILSGDLTEPQAPSTSKLHQQASSINKQPASRRHH